jgi:butyrate kinase
MAARSDEMNERDRLTIVVAERLDRASINSLRIRLVARDVAKSVQKQYR